jgi:hypothetical protein
MMAVFALGITFLIALLVLFAVSIIPLIFYLLTLQRALEKCAPHNRSMSPGLVWLQIIPFFNIIWQFFVVTAVSDSLSKEYAYRRLPVEGDCGRSLGIAMAVLMVCWVIPYVSVFAFIAWLVLWIIYWVKVAGLSERLDRAARYGASGGYPAGQPYQTPYPAPYSQAPYVQPRPAEAKACAACGAALALDSAFCGNCGSKAGQTG